MKFCEWVNWFELKGGYRFYLPPYFNLEFNENKGFVIWQKVGNYFELNQCATRDGHSYWYDWCMNKAKELGCIKGMTRTYRNPKAFARLFKGKVVGKELDIYDNPINIIEWEVK